MKFKNLVMLAAALTCIAGSTVMAEEKVSIKSASADSYEVVQVMTTKDKNYYQYYNSAYQYAVDIPRAATTADMNADGDGCYFQDPKDDAVYMTYAAKNTMGFTIDELYNMALGMNGSPTLTTNIKTKNSYAIGWTDGKKSYYHELYINDKNKTYTAFSVTYPTSKKDKYQAIIAHMSRSFMPNVQMSWIIWGKTLYRKSALWYNSLVNLGSPLSGNTIVVKGGGNGGTNVL